MDARCRCHYPTRTTEHYTKSQAQSVGEIKKGWAKRIARNKQIDANRREQVHPAFRKWAKNLKQWVLQQLRETQVEQDFNHALLRGLGYTTQSDVSSDQLWTREGKGGPEK